MSSDNNDKPSKPSGGNVIYLASYQRRAARTAPNELMHQFLGEIQDLAYQLDTMLYLAERSENRKFN